MNEHNMKFHKTLVTTILLAALTLCLGGCGNRQLRERFDTVERVVTDRPDSALALLREIPDPPRLGTADRARYDLLMAEARYMADSIDTVPTRLLEVAAYFDSENDSHNAARAYYYAGIMNRNAHRPIQSIINNLMADRIIQDSVTELKGKISRAIAYGSEDLMDYASALEFHKRAYGIFRSSRNKRFTGYELVNISRAYYATAGYDSSIRYADIVLGLPENTDRPGLAVTALRMKAKSYLELKDYSRVVAIYDTLATYGDRYIHPEDMRYKGMAYLASGNVDKATECEKVLTDMDPYDRDLEYQIKKKTGDSAGALGILSSLVDEQNSAVQNMWNTGHAALINDYFKAEEEKADDAIGYRNMIIWLTISGSSLVVLLLIVVIIKAVRHSRETRRSTQLQLSLLQNELESKKRTIENLKAGSHEEESQILMAGLFDTLSRVSPDLYKLYEPGSAKADLKKRLEEIRSSMFNEEFISSLRHTVDRWKDNIVSDFITDFPKATRNDILVMMFSILGFSSWFLILISIDTLRDRIG